jgi:hypothetical protein
MIDTADELQRGFIEVMARAPGEGAGAARDDERVEADLTSSSSIAAAGRRS